MLIRYCLDPFFCPLFCLSNYNSNIGGTLVLVDKKGEKTQIVDDVEMASAVDYCDILYLSNGQLFWYNNKVSTAVADNVSNFLVPGGERDCRVMGRAECVGGYCCS